MEDVLVIIPCLNEISHIRKTLTFALTETEGTRSVIVVADGGSSDGTIDVIKAFEQNYDNVKYLCNPGVLQSAGVNLAVETFGQKFRWFVRVDAHSEYPKGYIKTLVKDAEINGADSVVVGMLTKGTSCFQQEVAIVQNSILGNGGSGHRVVGGEGRWIDHGHHALMSTELFRSIGGYDEKFSHNEDAELDYRLSQAGGKIWLTAGTHSIYFPRDSFKSLFRQYRSYGQGRSKTIIKHKMIPRLRQMLPALVFPACCLALFSPLYPQMLIPVFVWFFLTLIVGLMLGVKHRVRGYSGLNIGLCTIVMHVSWSLGFCEGFVQEFKDIVFFRGFGFEG